MEIHIIRHTAVENPEQLCYGFSDIPLRDRFLEDFEMVKAGQDYDSVFVSPAERCQRLAHFFKFKFKTDERLREMNFGDWELKKWNDIPSVEIDPWYKDFVNVPAKNGESLVAMQTRVSEFWKDLLNNSKVEKVLLITHLGVIRLIIQQVLEFPLENMFRLQIDYGKRVVITFNNGIFSIQALNI
ncbi:MAG: alpha-ribazole phosphatase [Chryseobacterium sp.]|nr:alpha-ribazole phosphatase [Candidatus Chryseobacterium enterohippi]